MHAIDAASLQLAAIVDSSEDAIISTSVDGIIETWNRAAQRIFGYTPAEAIGRPIDFLIPDAQRNDELALVDRIRGGEVIAHYETVGLAQSGDKISLSVSISPILTPDGD